MKTLDISELRDSGLLQETNRQWFHPLGLALAITIDGDSSKLELLDARDDPEGFIFADGVMDQDKCKRFRACAQDEAAAIATLAQAGLTLAEYEAWMSTTGRGFLVS